MDNNNILQKLEGLESRYEEVSTLITDPDVIADQPRYVKLTKEWKDLGDIMDARTFPCGFGVAAHFKKQGSRRIPAFNFRFVKQL